MRRGTIRHSGLCLTLTGWFRIADNLIFRVLVFSEQFIQAFTRIFNHIQGYWCIFSHTHERATSGERGGLTCPFWKSKKSIFILEKNVLIVSILELHFHRHFHRERLVFHSIQYMNGCLAASDLLDMFTQWMKLYTIHYQCRCLKNVIHQIVSKNEWLLLPAKFTAKFGSVLSYELVL